MHTAAGHQGDPKILIDALSAREGGGITYVSNAIPALAEATPPGTLLILLSSEYQSSLMQAVQPHVEVVDAQVGPSPLTRAIWLERNLPTAARKMKADILFSVAETSSMTVPIPRVHLVGNANLFVPPSAALPQLARIKRGIRQLLWRPYVTKCLRSARALVHISSTMREIANRHISLPNGLHQDIIPNGVGDLFFQAPRLESAERSQIIICVATVTPHKNHGTLIRAVAEAYKRLGPPIKLQLVGAIPDESYREHLVQLAADLGVADIMEFVGRVDSRTLARLYSEARLLVLPSLLESFGFPLVEAMACGTPVLASDIAACRETCGNAATYFDPEDVWQLSNELLNILGSPSRLSEMSIASNRRAEQFRWERSATRLLGVLRSAVKA